MNSKEQSSKELDLNKSIQDKEQKDQNMLELKRENLTNKEFWKHQLAKLLPRFRTRYDNLVKNRVTFYMPLCNFRIPSEMCKTRCKANASAPNDTSDGNDTEINFLFNCGECNAEYGLSHKFASEKVESIDVAFNAMINKLLDELTGVFEKHVLHLKRGNALSL